jgi:hypothetical protein
MQFGTFKQNPKLKEITMARWIITLIAASFINGGLSVDLDEIRQEWSRYYSADRVDFQTKTVGSGQNVVVTDYFGTDNGLFTVERGDEIALHAINRDYGFELWRRTNEGAWKLVSVQSRGDKLEGTFSGTRSVPYEYRVWDSNLLELLDPAILSTVSVMESGPDELKISFTANGEARDKSERISLSKLKQGELTIYNTPPYLPVSYRLEFDGNTTIESRFTYVPIEGSLRLIAKHSDYVEGSEKSKDETIISYDVPPIKDTDFYLSAYGMTEPPIATSRDRSSYWMISLILVGILLTGIGFYVHARRRTG